MIDASVVVKWVVEEDGTAEALSLRRLRLTAPDLLIPECANILWKKVRRGELDAAEARIAAGLLERADVELHPTRRLVEPALRLAMAMGHPAYDCFYLALAHATGCDFVTADLKLCARVQAHGYLGRTIPLSDAPGRLGAESHG